MRFWLDALKITGVALLYAGTAEVTRILTNSQGYFGFIWPAGGLALAAVMVGGNRYGVSVFLGGVYLCFGAPGLQDYGAIAWLIGAPVSAWLGARLLKRDGDFCVSFRRLSDFTSLLVKAACLASSVNALAGGTALLLARQIPPSDWLGCVVQIWMGNALGVILTAPLIMVWWETLRSRVLPRRFWEGVLLLALSFVVGQIVFMDWFKAALGPVANGYWMFLVVTLIGIRLGLHGVLVILLLTTIQALMSVYGQAGYFAGPVSQGQVVNAWCYLMVLSVLGISLATYMTERRRVASDLRIGAIAFESQDGMYIANTKLEIIRVNKAFTTILDREPREVLGKLPTSLIPPDLHDQAASEANWQHIEETGAGQREIVLRKKNGDTLIIRATLTAVKNASLRTTHYVGTVTDVTPRIREQAQRQAEEAIQRDALVREVHHRIKNNLQGIVGVLREFARKHPDVQEPITQAVGQVQSIAVIHGLQGGSSPDRVHLSELTMAIAQGISGLWQKEIVIEIAQGLETLLVVATEAVPVALVLNELILNAVKHGDHTLGKPGVSLLLDPQTREVAIQIANHGPWTPDQTMPHTGLQLVDTLLPRRGAKLSREQVGSCIKTTLELGPPVIKYERADYP